MSIGFRNLAVMRHSGGSHGTSLSRQLLTAPINDPVVSMIKRALPALAAGDRMTAVAVSEDRIANTATG
jgi:hypothetical protein